jgi:putative membrane-bound dehydrogenase-like protein
MNTLLKISLAGSVALAACAAWAAPKSQRTEPLAAAEALASFQLDPGLRIELVAIEPLVVGPVAMAFDERGRLFVVEGRGYPDPIDNKTPPTSEGRVAILEDTDGDGRFDKRTDFATGLSYPNGIALWRGGVFVTCAPDILYLKDNDGDGIADERRVVLTGFDTTRTAQLRVSSPTLGLDGRIYVASGLNGGKVTSPLHPERAVVSFAPADGRFDPDSFLYETTGGRGQFGLSFDGFGRRFVSSNRHPVLQVVLEPWQLRRNPGLTITQVMQEVSKVEAEAKVWPISRASVSADFIPSLMNAPHTGTFTAACGVLMYGGTALPADYAGNFFICEPAQNLVQRQTVRSEGASFRSMPGDERAGVSGVDGHVVSSGVFGERTRRRALRRRYAPAGDRPPGLCAGRVARRTGFCRRKKLRANLSHRGACPAAGGATRGFFGGTDPGARCAGCLAAGFGFSALARGARRKRGRGPRDDRAFCAASGGARAGAGVAAWLSVR